MEVEILHYHDGGRHQQITPPKTNICICASFCWGFLECARYEMNELNGRARHVETCRKKTPRSFKSTE